MTEIRIPYKTAVERLRIGRKNFNKYLEDLKIEREWEGNASFLSPEQFEQIQKFDWEKRGQNHSGNDSEYQENHSQNGVKNHSTPFKNDSRNDSEIVQLLKEQLGRSQNQNDEHLKTIKELAREVSGLSSKVIEYKEKFIQARRQIQEEEQQKAKEEEKVTQIKKKRWLLWATIATPIASGLAYLLWPLIV